MWKCKGSQNSKLNLNTYLGMVQSFNIKKKNFKRCHNNSFSDVHANIARKMGKNWPYFCCVIGCNHQLTQYDRHPAEEKGGGREGEYLYKFWTGLCHPGTLTLFIITLRMRQMKIDTHMSENIGISPLKFYIQLPTTWTLSFTQTSC